MNFAQCVCWFHVSGYCRRKTIIVTDQRVTLMKELLTCVKLIKMYAWEKPFSKTITGKMAWNIAIELTPINRYFLMGLLVIQIYVKGNASCWK